MVLGLHFPRRAVPSVTPRHPSYPTLFYGNLFVLFVCFGGRSYTTPIYYP
jgi:hypothetical protein